jgi:hypothetical protein
MDAVGGPDAKKARWSPNSLATSASPNGNSRDAFANYGYGPQANMGLGTNAAQGNAFNGSPLYSTPSLTINTQSNGSGMASQMSPSAAGAQFAQQQAPQTPSAYSNFGAYNMLGMGMPGMNMLNGFPYGQMANFNQVSHD